MPLEIGEIIEKTEDKHMKTVLVTGGARLGTSLFATPTLALPMKSWGGGRKEGSRRCAPMPGDGRA
jgi:hypothetical protein